MEIFPQNRYYCICKNSTVIYSRTYNKGQLYIADEVFYYGGSYYEVCDMNNKFMGHLEDNLFEKYFVFTLGVIREVDEMFNNIMDGR